MQIAKVAKPAKVVTSVKAAEVANHVKVMNSGTTAVAKNAKVYSKSINYIVKLLGATSCMLRERERA